jgi:Cys-tRNA(Pro)/Cys-tRNA(Cys) deacylase
MYNNTKRLFKEINVMAQGKTNVMRILDSNDIDYDTLNYDNKDGKIDGVSVANKINKNVDMVYKTLVTKGVSKEIYVFVIPVTEELDLKKAAKTTDEKKIEMLEVKDINKYTGYIRGGCSPIGMKKKYKTFIDNSCNNIERIIVSGGKIGIQIELKTNGLIKVTDGIVVDLKK